MIHEDTPRGLDPTQRNLRIPLTLLIDFGEVSCKASYAVAYVPPLAHTRARGSFSGRAPDARAPMATRPSGSQPDGMSKDRGSASAAFWPASLSHVRSAHSCASSERHHYTKSPPPMQPRRPRKFGCSAPCLCSHSGISGYSRIYGALSPHFRSNSLPCIPPPSPST